MYADTSTLVNGSLFACEQDKEACRSTRLTLFNSRSEFSVGYIYSHKQYSQVAARIVERYRAQAFSVSKLRKFRKIGLCKRA